MGLFGGSKTTVVQNTAVTLDPTFVNNVNIDDSRLQGILDATQEGNQLQAKATLLQAQATVEAASAQKESAEMSAKALETGLMRAAVIGALATLAVNFGPKLLKVVRV